MNSIKMTSFALTVGRNAINHDPGSIIQKTGKVLYSNRHIPPTGYDYNEDGWLLTNVELPYYNVMLPRFIGNHLSPYAVFVQDLLVLTHLNNKPLSILTSTLRLYFSKYGYFLDRAMLDSAEAEVININNGKQLPPRM